MLKRELTSLLAYRGEAGEDGGECEVAIGKLRKVIWEEQRGLVEGRREMDEEERERERKREGCREREKERERLRASGCTIF